MSIASGITALVTALQTALNNRASVGASDYQMWLAQGNTGDMTAYRTSILGGDVDYATQFNNQLGTQPTAGVATESQTGVTQFATATELLAGALGGKAVSPLQLVNAKAIFDRGGLNNTTNWNNLVTPGVYLLNGGAGNPTGFPSGAYNYGILVVMVSGGGATQMYFPDSGSATLYWRHGFGAVSNGFGTKAWSYVQPSTVAPV